VLNILTGKAHHGTMDFRALLTLLNTSAEVTVAEIGVISILKKHIMFRSPASRNAGLSNLYSMSTKRDGSRLTRHNSRRVYCYQAIDLIIMSETVSMIMLYTILSACVPTVLDPDTFTYAEQS
jgi:hypothetical protein